MKQINRNNFIKPSILESDLSSHIENVRNGKEPLNSIYAHEEVKTTLKLIYNYKCYLCERRIEDDGQVEHFLPHHNDKPERAYDWENLHWSCGDCNHRKTQKEYKIQHGKKAVVDDILLIDPSNPPSAKKVEDLIYFDRYCKSKVKDIGETKAIKTCNFLNDSVPFVYRKNRWADFSGFLIENSKYIEYWRKIVVNDPISLTEFDSDRENVLNALEKADNAYIIYLKDDASFSTCIRYVLFEWVKISYSEFKKMSEYYRKQKNK